MYWEIENSLCSKYFITNNHYRCVYFLVDLVFIHCTVGAPLKSWGKFQPVHLLPRCSSLLFIIIDVTEIPCWLAHCRSLLELNMLAVGNICSSQNQIHDFIQCFCTASCLLVVLLSFINNSYFIFFSLFICDKVRWHLIFSFYFLPSCCLCEQPGSPNLFFSVLAEVTVT